MDVVLTVGGADPCGAAGAFLDMRVIERMGLLPAVVLSALVPQDITGVYGIYPVELSVFKEQLRAVGSLNIVAVKVSLLAKEEQVDAVREWLASLGREVPVVIDPVWRASAGVELLSSRVLRYMAECLFKRAWVVTPNTIEARLLTGEEVGTRSQMHRAARSIGQLYGARAVLVTGGHTDEPTCVDVLCVGDEVWEYEHERLPYSFRGAGSLLSTVLACYLVREGNVRAAVGRAIAYTIKALKENTIEAKGKRILHFPSEGLDSKGDVY